MHFGLIRYFCLILTETELCQQIVVELVSCGSYRADSRCIVSCYLSVEHLITHDGTNDVYADSSMSISTSSSYTD
jgi:hypothetical protein